MSRRLTNCEFLKRAVTTHGLRYIYKTEYVGLRKKIVIECPEHGEFLQTPCDHIHQKSGCPKCGGKLLLTQDEFISKANEMHNQQYDYSKVEYKNAKSKVVIICPKHGEFLQVPDSHLRGCGCKKCDYAARKLRYNKTQEKFLIDAKNAHGDEYDYSESKYISAKRHVTIICKKHGKFQQTPDNHINLKRGCSSCSGLDPKWQREVEAFVQSIYTGIIFYNDRTTIKSDRSDRFLELDIYLPKIRVGIECQGEYFHDEKHFPGVAQRDSKKQKLCSEAGITLICVWEDEWLNSETRGLVENQIRSVVLQ